MTAVELMKSPSCWPIPGYLPLVLRGGGLFDTAVLIESRGPVVYLGVCVAEPDLEGQVRRAEQKTYFTFAELAADWRVD